MIIKDSFKKKPHNEDLIEIKKVIDKGKLSGKSNAITTFETMIAELFEVESVVCCSSGTSAIIASLIAADISANDEVLIPCYAPLPTSFPVLSVGATPLYIDTMSSHSLLLSVEDLLRKASHKTKAIITVPLWGYPINYDDVFSVCNDLGIMVIDDAAQAHFSRNSRNQYLGTFADYGCFSLHDKKILSTGEGGFIIPCSQERESRLREIINLGHLTGLSYGLNFKLGALQAALGISRCKRVETELEARKQHANTIKAGLLKTNFEEIDFQGQPNYYNLVVKSKDNSPLKDQHQTLRLMGFETDYSKYGGAKYKQGILHQFDDGNIMQGDTVLENLIAIPTHPDLTQKEINYLVEMLEQMSC